MKAFICHFLPGSVFSLMVLFQMALAVSPVAAQTEQCAGLADVLGGLARNYGEAIVWQGERTAESRLVVTARPDGTTWTTLIVQDEVACVVAFGNDWSGVARPAGEDI